VNEWGRAFVRLVLSQEACALFFADESLVFWDRFKEFEVVVVLESGSSMK
jgi:hypothetical protein